MSWMGRSRLVAGTQLHSSFCRTRFLGVLSAPRGLDRKLNSFLLRLSTAVVVTSVVPQSSIFECYVAAYGVIWVDYSVFAKT